MQPHLAFACLLAACVALGSTGCATTSRASTSLPPASEPEASPEPASESQPPPAPAKAQRPKASPKASSKRTAAPRSAPEVKPPAESKPPVEARALVAARTPELRRPQTEGMNAGLGTTASEPVPFEPSSMTRPQRVSGREPELTAQARAERVRGTALVRCVVTREGKVMGCKLLNGLPHMDQELLEAVSNWRVTPATVQGRPLDVEYTFVVRIPPA